MKWRISRDSRISGVLAALFALALAAWAAPLPGPRPPVTARRAEQERFSGDPLAVRALNPVFETFPDNSLVDFSFLLDPPAGKQGWVVARPDGHFYFEKTGAPARFWGATVAANNVDIPKAKITEVVGVFARGGCNLLRLHELDNRGAEKYNLLRRCLNDEAWPNHDKSTAFDPEYRDRVDWWIAEARRHGLTVYLVLRGYRTFRAGDGAAAADLLDRAAKPYGLFNPRLIELQKRFADDWLFDHVNPYTGIPNGLDPAVAFIEIENEDSLFAFYNIDPNRWRGMIEPYRTEFARMWNRWLAGRYGSTDALRAAWTNEAGECPLGEKESLEEGTVELPAMAEVSLANLEKEPWGDPLRSPARARDGVRFAVDVQREFFATLRDHLRSRGSRALFTAVVDTHTLPDTWSVARELDFPAQNAYVDHPAFAAGQAWVGRQAFQNNNLVKEVGVWGPGARMAQWKWNGKPWMVREWTNSWPNEYRAASMLDIAALASVQGYDGLIHFDYKTWGNPDLISAFGMQPDPARWGLSGYAALMYLRGDLPPAKEKIAILYSEEDLSTWASFMSHLHRLALLTRVENFSPELADALEGEGSGAPRGAALTITSGRAGGASYRELNNATRFVLFDPRFAARAGAKENILAAAGYDFAWVRRPDGFPLQEVAAAGFLPAIVASAPGGAGEAERLCRAFYDPARRNLALGPVTEEEAFFAIARFLQEPERDAPALAALAAPLEGEWKTLDGRFLRDPERGVIRIAAERFCAVAGEIGPREGGAEPGAWSAGALRIECVSPIGAVVAASLDGAPLASARRYSVKMATVAHNRGQKLVRAEDAGQQGAPWVLTDLGAPPVQTEGKPSEAPTRVWIGGEPLLDVFLVNGTWEILIDRDRREVRLFCDTPNIRFRINPAAFGAEAAPEKTRARRFYYEIPPADDPQAGCDIHYPGFAKYMELRAE